MGLLDTFVKTVANKDSVQNSMDITGSMRLLDFGVMTKTYSDGTCDVTCMKKGSDNRVLKYHGIEILYPCGFKNVQNNQLCLLVNPFSSVYRTEDIKNPDFIGDHDQRCMKAIPLSNKDTPIFSGLDSFGAFNVSNSSMGLIIDKWSMYFGTLNSSSNTSVYLSDDGTVVINANKGMVQIIINDDEGIGFVHYGSDNKALEAFVMKPTGEKYSLYFCSVPFTFTKISDILNITEDKWKRIEKTDTNGVLHIYTGTTSSGSDRHLATVEDLYKLWNALKNHSHGVSGTSTNSTSVTPLNDFPQEVAGIIVKDGGTYTPIVGS